MTRIARTPARILLAALVTLGAAIAMWLAPSAAHAHDTLIESQPADGASLEVPPSEASLTFSAEIAPVGTAVELHGAAGAPVALPAAPVVEGTRVTQPLPPLDPGAYALDWRVVSSDGHPISGTVSFTVTGAAAPTGSAPAASTPAATIGGDSTPGASVPAVNTPGESEPAPAGALPVWAIVLIGLVGVGVIVAAVVGFRAAAARNEELRRRAERQAPGDDDA